MTIILGDVPDELVINLSANSPFSTSLQLEGDLTWDVGTVIEIRIGTTTWEAAITGGEAAWTLLSADVATIIDERHATLWFNGKLWATGHVMRNA